VTIFMQSARLVNDTQQRRTELPFTAASDYNRCVQREENLLLTVLFLRLNNCGRTGRKTFRDEGKPA
jgi:hypothetical protein